jgi:putative transposon-encoded protein
MMTARGAATRTVARLGGGGGNGGGGGVGGKTTGTTSPFAATFSSISTQHTAFFASSVAAPAVAPRRANAFATVPTAAPAAAPDEQLAAPTKRRDAVPVSVANEASDRKRVAAIYNGGKISVTKAERLLLASETCLSERQIDGMFQNMRTEANRTKTQTRAEVNDRKRLASIFNGGKISLPKAERLLLASQTCLSERQIHGMFANMRTKANLTTQTLAEVNDRKRVVTIFNGGKIYPTKAERLQLASETCLSERQIHDMFMNMRRKKANRTKTQTRAEVNDRKRLAAIFNSGKISLPKAERLLLASETCLSERQIDGMFQNMRTKANITTQTRAEVNDRKRVAAIFNGGKTSVTKAERLQLASETCLSARQIADMFNRMRKKARLSKQPKETSGKRVTKSTKAQASRRVGGSRLRDTTRRPNEDFDDVADREWPSTSPPSPRNVDLFGVDWCVDKSFVRDNSDEAIPIHGADVAAADAARMRWLALSKLGRSASVCIFVVSVCCRLFCCLFVVVVALLSKCAHKC